MSNWCIQVEQENPFSTQGTTFTKDRPFEKAEQISRENLGREVTLDCFARVRKVFLNGEVVREWPSLDHFYTGVTETKARIWAEGLTLPKEDWED